MQKNSLNCGKKWSGIPANSTTERSRFKEHGGDERDVWSVLELKGG